ncbi:aldose 1-epimerase family protein [Fusibacter ferrireducens]|uniref:Aldose 1-epimerase family protein n=1 Tax=Fusibacter ferrireducens TaxID=2785058 RepID=A0ABR9ZTM5_9FIRM|nr:aldose 1-epimerase family protein [Fusibacter ferrireducens]MBF4693797.1 aldose 1-epimerase family protein [Fusibacter ferrireducens]
MIELKNEYINVKVAIKGAELTSLFDVKKNKELLWQGDKQYWGRQAPILFPIVGSLKDGQYIYEDVKYELPRHGFARDHVFVLEACTDDQATLILRENAELMSKYPFQFELAVTYKINKNSLQIHYCVKNMMSKEMFFSIGAHPAFNCDLNSEKSFLRIEMQTEEASLESLKIALNSGLIVDGYRDIALEAGRLRLTPKLFEEDALIFKGEHINGFILNSDGEGDILKFECCNYPYIGIWSPKAPFVCIEPWHGIADFEGTSQNLKEKQGIIKLDGQTEFECDYSITLI